jgi:predicted ribosomally synthesized peptide with SipW-like signal peptide
MNKKVIISLVLVALMGFGTAIGTFAWFTSQATSDANTFKTGTLSIGGLAGTSALRTFTLSNLYPGLEGSKSDYITVKNNGSINLQYSVSANYDTGDGTGYAPLYNIAKVKVTKASGDVVYNGNLNALNKALVNATLPVGKSETLNFTVSLPDETNNDYQGKTAKVNFVFDATQNRNTSEWVDGGGYGTATLNNNGSINLKGAPYSYSFSNKNYDWSGNYYTETDVYLDTNMAAGTGFDYSVAMGKPDGTHLRDFIFHVAKDTSTGKLLVGASNNSSNSAAREDLETAFANNQIIETGWYTFQHKFYKNGDNLEAQLSIIDANKNVVYTKKISTTDTSFGVPKYSWFTFITVPNGVDVQNHRDYVANN